MPLTTSEKHTNRGLHYLALWLFALALGSLIGMPCFAQSIDNVYTLTVSRSALTTYIGPLPVTQSFIVTKGLPIPSPSVVAPAAVLIFLPGSDGNIQLTPTSLTINPSDGTLDINSSSSLVRSRWLFAGRNFVAVSLDSATDFQATGGLTGNQGSPEHVTDVLQVIAWVRTTYPGLKVFLVGTSRGTAGAFVAASYPTFSGGPDGLVFTDPVNVTGDKDSLLSVPSPSSITVPTLILYNTLNACSKSLNANNATVASMLTGTTVAVQTVTGGFKPLDSDACHPLTYHGFFGIEPATVTTISKWIKSVV